MQVSEDETTLDDVGAWIVHDGVQVVFPPNVASRPASAVSTKGVEWRDWYRVYLASATWREKRNGALKNAAFRCERCGTDEQSLHVHHRTYARVGGHELPEDLEVLCEPCHYRHHNPTAASYLDYLEAIDE